MEINGPPPTPPRLMQSLTRHWQLGQVVQATVVKQPTPSTVVLQINNLKIHANSSSPLPVGQQLNAEIIKLGNRPILQLQMSTQTLAVEAKTLNNGTQRIELQLGIAPLNKTIPPPKTAINPATITPLEQALKQFLPKQTSMSALLANLTWINNAKATTLALPPIVTQLSKKLLNALPERTQISQPGVLKQAVLNSGIFLENKLSKLPIDGSNRLTHSNVYNKLDSDLKVALLRLIGSIKQVVAITPKQAQTSPALASVPQQITLPATAPTLPNSRPQAQPSVTANLANISNVLLLLQELGKQAEASLARTQLHQIASTTNATDTNNNQWALELPVRNNPQVDIFDMVIEDESNPSKEDEDEKHRWSVNLAFDLPGLGPVHSKLQLIENKIVTTFWAERPETRELFKTHQEELLKRYRDNGVDATELHCFQGKPPPHPRGAQPYLMLDIKV